MNVDDEQSDEDSQSDQEEDTPTDVADQNVKEEKPSSTEPAEKQTSKKKRKKKKKKGKGETESGKHAKVSTCILLNVSIFCLVLLSFL